MNQTDAPRILFLADAGPNVGGGHVMRCLTLARALAALGAECAFAESRAAAPILRRFGWPEQTPLAMAAADDVAGLVAHAEAFAERWGAACVVVDHYKIGAEDEERLRGGVRKLVALDDLADRRRDCDLVVDPGYGRRPEAYRGLAPSAAAVLTGPAYALVRPDFAAARPRALSRRARHGPVRRALVSLGLTDLGGITGRVVEALAPLLGEARLDVAVGSDAPSLPALRLRAEADRRIHLWIDTAEMASLMADADLAIGAGGSSVWERAAVGLPSATVALADNQREMVERMAASGLTLALDAETPDFEARLAEAWRLLAADASLRWRLAERSAELCDGQGAPRTAEAVLQL
ncbi:MAG: UDP-2,4-diacetamido-2,4,6-trideoxy-beta-L-altropyranose hydrolase, partial [Caulobacteraceae bacterium]